MFTPDTSKFKNNSGTHVLKAMFYELDHVAEEPYAQYTLKPYDHTVDGVTYPSLKKLYVELEDPTEYLFATTYLDGYEHWKKLTKTSWFKTHLTEWREELELRLRAKALLRIRKTAEAGSKDSLTADKLLLSGAWKTEEEKTRGRPSKQKIKEEAERLFEAKTEFDDDFDRILGVSTNLN